MGHVTQGLFITLLAQGKLYRHCAEVETQAQDMFDTLIEQMKEAEGVTEQLKEENQMDWIQRMGNIQQRATSTYLVIIFQMFFYLFLGCFSCYSEGVLRMF